MSRPHVREWTIWLEYRGHRGGCDYWTAKTRCRDFDGGSWWELRGAGGTPWTAIRSCLAIFDVGSRR